MIKIHEIIYKIYQFDEDSQSLFTLSDGSNLGCSRETTFRIESLENLPCFLHEFRKTCVVGCTTIIH